MRNALLVPLCAIIVVCGATATGLADVPHQINIQGILTEADGNPITSTVAVLFAIWDLPIGGDSLWSEIQPVTPDLAGRFNVLLGKISPIPDSAFHMEAFLSLSVESSPEMVPRQQLVSVAYAYRARMAEEAGVSYSAAPGSVNSASIQDKSIGFIDIGQNGTVSGQVMKWNGAEWIPANDNIGPGDPSPWTVIDSVIRTNDAWGITRGGANNALLGSGAQSMVNLGVACTTGVSGEHISHATISGGFGNQATGPFSTVGGGEGNFARGTFSVVAGGGGPEDWDTNSARGSFSVIGGGRANIADSTEATIGGGHFNLAGDFFTTVSGGNNNRATTIDAAVGGGGLNIAGDTAATIAGGFDNHALGAFSIIGGGRQNYARGRYSVIAGGGGPTLNDTNLAAGDWSCIGGGAANLALAGRSTVSGGYHNIAGDVEATVGGGQFNTAGGAQSVVAGGESNDASGWRSAVGGGYADSAAGDFSTIGGGMANVANNGRSTVGGGYMNVASGTESVVSGGQFNMASGAQSVVAGGESNLARNWRTVVGGGYADSALSDYSVVGGGIMNVARDTAATVGGGQINLASGHTSTVSGGSGNRATGQWSVIGGGAINTAEAPIATVGGGGINRSTAWGSTVSGGYFNEASGQYAVVSGGGGNDFDKGNSASGDCSVVPGGQGNVASGSYSFAAGWRAQAVHPGSFVWADSTDADFSSWMPNEFAIRATEGLRLDANGYGYAASFENAGSGDGVRAFAATSYGSKFAALYAYNRGTCPGIYAYSTAGEAGYFDGSVTVIGYLTKAGGGFKIDHPLDPANKYLNHSFVESPDMKNVYDGVATLNAVGEAVVELPEWFQVLNRDFRYQLTPIGAPGPNLYIADEITNNHFRIAGGTSGMKVSWQVTGIRQDVWANAHRLPPEETKPPAERGKYLHPKEYSQPASMGIGGEPAAKIGNASQAR